MKTEIKNISIIGLIIVLFIVIGMIFWQEQYKYYRSVEIPDDAKQVNLLDTIKFKNELLCSTNRVQFIHFFDVSCKFSEINIEHIRLFSGKYKNQLSFYVIIMGKHNLDYLLSFKEKFKVPEFVKLISDKSCEIAKICGVFSTPQAVIIDTNQTLYFRGNYNSSTGLCTPANIGSSSPAVAIRYKINNAPAPNFPSYMLLPWGCELSVYKKELN